MQISLSSLHIKQILINFIIIVTEASCDSNLSNLVKAWKGLGWNRIAYLQNCPSQSGSLNSNRKLALRSSIDGIALSFACGNKSATDGGNIVTDDMSILTSILVNPTAADSVMFIVTDTSDFKLTTFSLISGCVTSFFLLYPEDLTFFRAACFHRGKSIVLNRWSWKDTHSARFHEKYDLQGTELSMISLDWEPEVSNWDNRNMIIASSRNYRLEYLTAHTMATEIAALRGLCQT